MLSLLLLAAIVFVGVRTYELWQEGPWDLPKAAKAKESPVDEGSKKEPPRLQLVSAKNIIDKNLFDPQRGASRAQEAEASSIAMQRMRSTVLMGTAILGSSRYAIFQEPSTSRSPTGQPAYLRLKLGDTVEGFRLSEIHEKKAVFTKGTSKVEVALDFFQKVGETKQGPGGTMPPTPGVVPNIPRRGNLPSPPVSP